MEPKNYMKLALELARSAAGQTSPNPLVGAICVKEGQIIGTGAHKGGTAPCTELILSSGILRVFIASIDPFPSVNGKGIELLKAAGIEVSTGVLEEEAEQLNRAFFHFVKHGQPYVTLKAAATLDGRLSTQNGDSKWITSEVSRTDVHHLSHTHDAILVGVQTVLHDSPFLTTRLPHGGKNPIRIILDRHLRTPATENVITDSAVETIIFTLDSMKIEPAFLAYPLVTIESISKEVDFLEEVLTRLANKGIMTLFVKGGGRIHTSFINAQFADELYLYMAPQLIGNGSSLFMDGTRNLMAERELIRFIDVQTIGDDIRPHAKFLKKE